MRHTPAMIQHRARIARTNAAIIGWNRASWRAVCAHARLLYVANERNGGKIDGPCAADAWGNRFVYGSSSALVYRAYPATSTETAAELCGPMRAGPGSYRSNASLRPMVASAGAADPTGARECRNARYDSVPEGASLTRAQKRALRSAKHRAATNGNDS